MRRSRDYTGVRSPRRPAPPLLADEQVRRWKWGRQQDLRERANEIERTMRKLVVGVVGKNPPADFDPNTLLDHPDVGAELLRLAREWLVVRARFWGEEAST